MTKKSEVAAALKEAIKAGGPVVIDAVIEKDDKVYPMVPAGKPLTEVFDASDIEE